jgi:hypothetical protein
VKPHPTRRWRLVALAALVGGCAPGPPSQDPIFVEGRAVAVAGDSLLAVTRRGDGGIRVRDRRTGAVSVRAEAVLRSPHHLEEVGGRWYASDVDEQGGAWLVVFTSQWEVQQRIRLNTIATAPHQFAVLPDGRIVLEAPDGQLVALHREGVSTFATFEPGPRTGFLVGAQGGVLHAVPDRSYTLYNENGNVRWWREWEWREEAFVSDLATDARGRMHILLGEGQPGTFVAFTMSTTTGEIIRFSEPGPVATFGIERLGEIVPDEAARWFGGAEGQTP